VLPFLVGGRSGALFTGLGEVAAFGNEYVSVVAKAEGGRSLAIAAGIPCWFEQIPTLLVLAALGASDLFRRSDERAPLAAAAWGFAAAAVVGTSYTLRFFSHDNVQLWPALAVLAVRPSGLVARALDRFRWPVMSELVAPLALGWLAVWPGWRRLWDYVHFMGDRDDLVADICRDLQPSLPANEPVLGWGWSAWSVYEHCGRRAPGRVFKVMASVTTVNTNTCNNGFGPMRLRSGAEPRRFLTELERRPPSLFLWSNYFKEMGGDPLDEWPALTAFVRDRYTPVDRRGPFVAFLRSDLLPGASAVVRQEALDEPDGGNGLYGWPGLAGSVWTSTSRTPENSPLMASITQCVTR
jgi:hypothetical protein